jgi:hypothetical protein
MFLEKGDCGGGVFGSILNLALCNMLIHAVDNPLDKAMDRLMQYCRVNLWHDVAWLGLCGETRAAAPNEQSLWYQFEDQCEYHSRYWQACNGMYDGFGTLVEVVDAYLAMLEHVNEDENAWSDAEYIFCLELLTSGMIGITLCGHIFHHLYWLNHCQVLCLGQTQAPCPMCRTNVTVFCHGYP